MLLFLISFNSYAEEHSKCIECHKKITPGIVSKFKEGKKVKAGLACSTCHGSEHVTDADFANARIPTPDICAKCHEDKVK